MSTTANAGAQGWWDPAVQPAREAAVIRCVPLVTGEWARSWHSSHQHFATGAEMDPASIRASSPNKVSPYKPCTMHSQLMCCLQLLYPLWRDAPTQRLGGQGRRMGSRAGNQRGFSIYNDAEN